MATKRHVVKVFSATMAKDREMLGEKVMGWLDAQRNLTVNEIRTHQSSDHEFHCVTIIILGMVE